MSGIAAVKKIVETEAQAKSIVENAKSRSQEILSQASQEAERARQEVLSQAQRQREEILSSAKVHAEAEAGKSDLQTTELLESYQKSFDNKRELAVKRAIELVLRG